MDSWPIFLFLAFLICMSGFFSASETAITSVNKVRLESLAEDGDKRAKRTLKIAKEYDRTISAILVGNNIVNIAATSVCTSLAISTGFMGENSVAASTFIMTIVVLLFGEVLPKTYAKYNSESFALTISGVMTAFLAIIKPVTWLILGIQNGFLKFFKKDMVPSVTEKELLNIIETSEHEGVIDEQRSELMQSVLSFDATTVKEVITPRVDVVALSVGSSKEEVLKVLTDERFTRIPVYEKNLDNIVGILHAKDYYEEILKGNDSIDLKDVITKPYFVYREQKISSVLTEMRTQKIHLAIVLDDYGGTLGIVSLEDLLEELVGEIYDEDEETDGDFIKVKEGLYSVSGDYNVYETLEEIGFKNLKDFDSEYSSVGGWAFEMLEKIPEVGEEFTYEGVKVKITEMDDQRVLRVSIEYNLDDEENEENL